jgi:hypothetical protein
VFSGRPDPEWTVDADTADALIEVWEQLAPRGGPAAVPPPLGYRGVALRSPDGRVWSAYAGTVMLDDEVRADSAREFERRLLATAPPGAVPRVL